MTRNRTLADVVESVANGHDRGIQVAVLFGAGCSVKGGIPTAAGIVEDVRVNYPQAYGRAQEKTYQACMAELTWAERRDLIASYVASAKVNWAHIAIAQLMNAGYIDRALTTNFDPLLLKACAFIGLFPAVYDIAASDTFKPAALASPSILFLHGQHSGFRLLNTSAEFNEHATRASAVFGDASLRNRIWIIVGYSGSNDPIFSELSGVPGFDNGLYWVGYGSHLPEPHVESFLESRENTFHVPGFDADDFLVLLARSFGQFPPRLIAAPFSHMMESIQALAAYTVPGEDASLDVTRPARRMIHAAIERYESDRDRIRALAEASFDLMSGNYSDAVNVFAAQGQDDESQEYRAWAYQLEAGRLLTEAQESDGPAEHLCERAIELTRKAISAAPHLPQAHNNLGHAYSVAAELKHGDRSTLIAQAEEAFARAVSLKLDYHKALLNWGELYLRESERAESRERARDLATQAEQKFLTAVSVQSDYAEGWDDLGVARSRLAEHAPNSDRERLWSSADEAFQRAITLQPQMREVYLNLGNSLARRAEMDEVRRRELFDAAYRNYERAIQIDPSFGSVYVAWSGTLWSDGRLAFTHDVARARYEEALRRLDEGISNAGETSQMRDQYGAIQADLAISWGVDDAGDLLREARSNFRAALRLDPRNRIAVVNLANSFADEALVSADDEARRLFALADDEMEGHARMFEADSQFFVVWSGILGLWSDRALSEQAEAIAAKAKKAIDSALALEPQSPTALRNLVAWHLQLGRRRIGEDAVIAFSEAATLADSVAHSTRDREAYWLSGRARMALALGERKNAPEAAELAKQAVQSFVAAFHDADATELNLVERQDRGLEMIYYADELRPLGRLLRRDVITLLQLSVNLLGTIDLRQDADVTYRRGAARATVGDVTGDLDMLRSGFEDLRRATELDSGNAVYWASLANSRLALSRMQSEKTERVRLLDLALNDSKQALTLDAEDPYILATMGYALLAKVNDENRHMTAVGEAEAMLANAEDRAQGYGLIGLAYCAALRNDEATVRQLLERAAGEDRLDEEDLSEPALDPFRGQGWFARLLERVPHRMAT